MGPAACRISSVVIRDTARYAQPLTFCQVSGSGISLQVHNLSTLCDQRGDVTLVPLVEAVADEIDHAESEPPASGDRLYSANCFIERVGWRASTVVRGGNLYYESIRELGVGTDVTRVHNDSCA